MHHTFEPPYGSLFAQERRDELRRALCEKVLSGLDSLRYVAIADVERIVGELVEQAGRGPYKQLHVQRNDDGSYRPFCMNCEKPRCCTVFETIRLTADDVLNLSRHFAMSPHAFLKKHCERYVDAIQPKFICRLKTAMPCEFLHKDQCSVYADRPERCRNFPLQHSINGENFVIYPWCNYFFNLLWHEATLQVLEHILQEYHSNQARIRFGGVIEMGVRASNAGVRE